MSVSEFKANLYVGDEQKVLEFLKDSDINKSYNELGCVRFRIF